MSESTSISGGGGKGRLRQTSCSTLLESVEGPLLVLGGDGKISSTGAEIVVSDVLTVETIEVSTAAVEGGGGTPKIS